jgi:hypothetical protein
VAIEEVEHLQQGHKNIERQAENGRMRYNDGNKLLLVRLYVVAAIVSIVPEQ